MRSLQSANRALHSQLTAFIAFSLSEPEVSPDFLLGFRLQIDLFHLAVLRWIRDPSCSADAFLLLRKKTSLLRQVEAISNTLGLYVVPTASVLVLRSESETGNMHGQGSGVETVGVKCVRTAMTFVTFVIFVIVVLLCVERVLGGCHAGNSPPVRGISAQERNEASVDRLVERDILLLNPEGGIPLASKLTVNVAIEVRDRSRHLRDVLAEVTEIVRHAFGKPFVPEPCEK